MITQRPGDRRIRLGTSLSARIMRDTGNVTPAQGGDRRTLTRYLVVLGHCGRWVGDGTSMLDAIYRALDAHGFSTDTDIRRVQGNIYVRLFRCMP